MQLWQRVALAVIFLDIKEKAFSKKYDLQALHL
jgi:hypothetical protein